MQRNSLGPETDEDVVISFLKLAAPQLGVVELRGVGLGIGGAGELVGT